MLIKSLPQTLVSLFSLIPPCLEGMNKLQFGTTWLGEYSGEVITFSVIDLTSEVSKKKYQRPCHSSWHSLHCKYTGLCPGLSWHRVQTAAVDQSKRPMLASDIIFFKNYSYCNIGYVEESELRHRVYWMSYHLFRINDELNGSDVRAKFLITSVTWDMICDRTFTNSGVRTLNLILSTKVWPLSDSSR